MSLRRNNSFEPRYFHQFDPITLGEYKKRRARKNRAKQFRGWVHIHSKTGSDWGLFDLWNVISGPYATKSEAEVAMVVFRHSDGCPCNVVKLYW
jgi:hypothetical protein